MGEVELCDRVGLLPEGTLIAVGSPNELRRRAFDGEFIQLALGGDPGDLGARLEVLEKIGRVVEVRRDEEAEEAVSSVRLAVEDADVAPPKVLDALNGADGRSLDVPKPSFDEISSSAW